MKKKTKAYCRVCGCTDKRVNLTDADINIDLYSCVPNFIKRLFK